MGKSILRTTRILGLFLVTLLLAAPAGAQVLGGGRSAKELSTSGLMMPAQRGIDFGESGLKNAAPPKFSEDEPMTLESDEMGYDQQYGIVVARGNVEVVQGPYIMHADTLTYFQQRDVVTARGNVSMLQPTGDVYFADYVELKNGMKTGVIGAFSARLADNSVFAAREAHKLNASVTVLKKAVYSPCHLCEDMEPFWQVKADTVRLNQKEERIYYNDAQMEFFGTPVFYTPYFSHPMPDADAKSGFLTPDYSRNKFFGTVIRTPYYWRISPDKDLLLDPWYSTDQGPLLSGTYNQLTDNGKYQAVFSGTYPHELDANGNPLEGNEFRGHIDAHGSENMTDYSRVGFDLRRSSDDTYMRRYGFGSDRVLFSRLYAEAARGRDYALAQGLAIQGLRLTDNADTTPLVLPTLEGYYETKPDENNIRYHIFADAQSLTRDIGPDQNRLSITEGMSMPMITSGGHILTPTLNMRQDMYDISDQPVGLNEFNGTKTRLVPQAALEWRYPLIRSDGGDSVTIEPVVLGVAQPQGNNPVEIPNEDNTLIELTDTNLFSIDRMPGLDTIDSGSRLAYGFRGQYLFADGDSVDTLFGQNYNFDDTPFPNSNTPDEHFSDYIGRLALSHQPLAFGYRFALDHESFTPNRNELSVSFIKPWLSLDATYRDIKNNRYLLDSEEGILNASLPLTDDWTFYTGGRRDLKNDEMIAANAGLLYRNECFNLIVQGLRTYTRDRDIEPNTEFTVRLGFKNLGEFGDN